MENHPSEECQQMALLPICPYLSWLFLHASNNQGRGLSLSLPSWSHLTRWIRRRSNNLKFGGSLSWTSNTGSLGLLDYQTSKVVATNLWASKVASLHLVSDSGMLDLGPRKWWHLAGGSDTAASYLSKQIKVCWSRQHWFQHRLSMAVNVCFSLLYSSFLTPAVPSVFGWWRMCMWWGTIWRVALQWSGTHGECSFCRGFYLLCIQTLKK